MTISSKAVVKSVEDVITKQKTEQVKQHDFSFKKLQSNFSELNGMSLTSGPWGPSSP